MGEGWGNGHWRIELGQPVILSKVFLDGVEQTNLTYVKAEADVHGLATLTLRVYPEVVEIEGDMVVREQQVVLVPSDPTN